MCSVCECTPNSHAHRLKVMLCVLSSLQCAMWIFAICACSFKCTRSSPCVDTSYVHTCHRHWSTRARAGVKAGMSCFHVLVHIYNILYLVIR